LLTVNSICVVDNQVWGVDSGAAAPGALVAYDDYLATEVPVLTAPGDGIELTIDPVTGRAEWATLAWDAMGTGGGLCNNYDIRITEVTDTGWAAARAAPAAVMAVPFATAPEATVGVGAAWNIPLLANKSYMWRVRVRNQVSGDGIRSGWSESRVINIGSGTAVLAPHTGPQLLGPAGGAMDVQLRPGFSWAPVYGATAYEFILATDSGLTSTVAGTPATVNIPSFQVTTDLSYNTTYFWSVRAIQPTEGAQSVGTFTTMAKAEPPVVVEPTPPPQIVLPEQPAPITPAYIWAIVIIGAILVIAVIVLIVRTRRVV
jgi:hypothetical protein